jgi:hypothetical protein
MWKTEFQLPSTNRFSPLDNLKVHQKKNELVPVNKSVNSPVNHLRKNPSVTNKIPTIINGRVESSAIPNFHNNKTKILKVKPTKNNKYVHKVHIIGDSHLKGVTTKINQYLGSNFVVSSFIKPGANVKQIVETQEIEFNCLGKKDLIVVNGGSNDLINNSEEDKSALSSLLKFAHKYANTNVLMLNVPIRYDSLTNYRTNYDIMNFNDKLQKRTKLFDHVHLIEMTTDRKYFTNHGLHQNKLGKERIAKEIARLIRGIVNSRPNNEPVYPLHWKEEHISMSTKIDNALPFNFTSNESNVSDPVIKLPQEHCTQQKLSKLGRIQRTSNRLKKTEMYDVVEPVVDNSALDEVEDGKTESYFVSDSEFRTVNVEVIDEELVKLEENNDDTRCLCIENSEIKKVEEDKSFRVSKSMNDAKSVTVLVNDKNVTEKADDDLSVTREKELHGSGTIMANNDISVTELAVSDTSMWELRRPSSRTKIPASRSTDFLWLK